jgi:rubrerythrin
MAKNTDVQKLKALLKYWIEHNKEHSEEFQEWAEKVDAMNQPDVAVTIRQAVIEMDKATELLLRALKILG